MHRDKQTNKKINTNKLNEASSSRLLYNFLKTITAIKMCLSQRKKKSQKDEGQKLQYARHAGGGFK